MNLDDVKDKQAVITELKLALKNARLSQAWAADTIGVTKAHLSRVLSKKVEPSLEFVIKLKELAIKVDSLKLDKAI